MSSSNSKTSKVPASRWGRFAQLGTTATGLAMGGVAEGARRLFKSGDEQSHASVFVSVANARRLTKRLSRMRGAAMKLGQMLSLETEDLLPKEVAEILKSLRADADWMPEAQRNQALTEGYGETWRDEFAEFDITPVAAASIGQVHRATTHQGTSVAVKIQYPGVRDSIDSDVDNLSALFKLARVLPFDVDYDGMTREAKRQLHREADYAQEAATQTQYAALADEHPHWVVPKIHASLCRPNILVSDFEPGTALESLGEDGVSQELRDHFGTQLVSLTLHEMFRTGLMQTDPNFANFQVRDRDLILYDFGACYEMPQHLRDGYRKLIGALLDGEKETLATALDEMGFLPKDKGPMDRKQVVDFVWMTCEPMAHEGPYDFWKSDLPQRARKEGFELAVKERILSPPPPESLVFQRKFGGIFLMCSAIKAQVDCRRLAMEVLGR